MRFLSPAKVNLFFRVLKKREDGFHDVSSIYQAVSIFDIIDIERSKEDEFSSNVSFLKPDDSNLIIKALNLFRAKTKIDLPVKINLQKNIPIEAGLGGGSGNAATTLFALNELFENPLEEKDLIDLAKQIGSDVAFFFSSGSAICTNKGDIFENIKIQVPDFYLAKTSFGMKTKDVYVNFDLKKASCLDPENIVSSYKNNSNVYINDLETSAFAIDERLKKIKQNLYDMGFDKVCMTGSGSTFMAFGNKKEKSMEEISFYLVQPIQRKEKKWYAFSKKANHEVVGQ
jgi:4-diphosphocytidyl-2-C-methyl-D-erythritol kinase